MNAVETGDLLGLMAFYDNRILGEGDVVAWLRVIGDLDYADSTAAVLAHYGGLSTERMMPGHLRAGVRRIRSDRIARSVIPAPPHELADTPRAYQRALQAGIGLAAEGRAPLASDQPRPLAITGPAAERPDLKRPRRLSDQIGNLRRMIGTARTRPTPVTDPQAVARQQAAEAGAARQAELAAKGEPS